MPNEDSPTPSLEGTESGEGRPRLSATLFRVCLLLTLLCFLFGVYRYSDYLLDDAFISLRYARNLIEAQGLVFNVGERVEGYTNFLWVMLGAALLGGGLDPVAGLKAFSLAAALLLIWSTSRLERLGRKARWMTGEGTEPRAPAHSPNWAIVFLLPLPAFAYWACTSMETMLFVSLFLLFLYLGFRETILGRGNTSTLVAVLLALTRPEGVYFFLLGVSSFVSWEWLGRGRVKVRRMLLRLILFGLLYGTYFTWRLLYYGQLLPNTFYAKVTGGSDQFLGGLQYSLSWALSFPLLAAALAAPAFLFKTSEKRRYSLFFPVWLVALGVAIYPIAIGGDSMPFHRFFLPLLPLAAVLLAWLPEEMKGRAPRPMANLKGPTLSLLVVLLLALHIAAGWLGGGAGAAFVAHRIATVGRLAGLYFSQSTSPDSILAVNTAGALPYYSGRRAVDMLGLTVREIATQSRYLDLPGWSGHQRGWGDYVLSRRPDVILWYNSAGLADPHYLGDRQLADNPYFRFFYVLRRTDLAPPGGVSEDDERRLGRFLGTPFGSNPEGRPFLLRDLGLLVRVDRWLVPASVVFPGTVSLTYFVRRSEFDPLWSEAGEELDGFLQKAADFWKRRESIAEIRQDPSELEALLSEVRTLVSEQRFGEAREILEASLGPDGAGPPSVFEYLAKIAVLERDLFGAIGFQLKTLQLQPESPAYRRNLLFLLTVPFAQFPSPPTE